MFRPRRRRLAVWMLTALHAASLLHGPGHQTPVGLFPPGDRDEAKDVGPGRVWTSDDECPVCDHALLAMVVPASPPSLAFGAAVASVALPAAVPALAAATTTAPSRAPPLA